MKIRDRIRNAGRALTQRDGGTATSVAFLMDSGVDICVTGYTSLDKCPEIMAGCSKIAEMVSTVTIRLMENTKDGDVRIRNELSKKIDVNPEKHMTRSTWMHGIVMDMLLYGKGNALVIPHTWKGNLVNLEPIAASRVSYLPIGYRDYKVSVDGGRLKKPEDVLHFVYNPDKLYKWKGRGIDVSLRVIADGLEQARKTKNAFMASEFKPSIIVKVDALTTEFASQEGRQKLLDSYVKSGRQGEPWLIPAQQFEVEQVKPLSLADLAIADTIKIDKAMAAAIIGVPGFILGVGEYNKAEYNSFVQGKIMAIVKTIMQELTKKLIIKEDWYLDGNVWSLMDYDLKETSAVLLAGADRGYVNGDEWRDRMHMNPAGLKEFKILENYLPYDMSGKQKKLIQDQE